jgi:hypothetical protein
MMNVGIVMNRVEIISELRKIIPYSVDDFDSILTKLEDVGYLKAIQVDNQRALKLLQTLQYDPFHDTFLFLCDERDRVERYK